MLLTIAHFSPRVNPKITTPLSKSKKNMADVEAVFTCVASGVKQSSVVRSAAGLRHLSDFMLILGTVHTLSRGISTGHNVFTVKSEMSQHLLAITLIRIYDNRDTIRFRIDKFSK